MSNGYRTIAMQFCGIETAPRVAVLPQGEFKAIVWCLARKPLQCIGGRHVVRAPDPACHLRLLAAVNFHTNLPAPNVTIRFPDFICSIADRAAR
jgi:hypothetical protein